MIYNFTWSGLNTSTVRLARQEATCFGNILKHNIWSVLEADPTLRLVCLSKVYLSDAYMRLWFRMKDALSLTFLIPKNHPTDTQLIGFHLDLPMGYIDSAALFCDKTETATEMSNNAIT